jgi:hypothetical protein
VGAGGRVWLLESERPLPKGQTDAGNKTSFQYSGAAELGTVAFHGLCGMCTHGIFKKQVVVADYGPELPWPLGCTVWQSGNRKYTEFRDVRPSLFFWLRTL